MGSRGDIHRRAGIDRRRRLAGVVPPAEVNEETPMRSRIVPALGAAIGLLLMVMYSGGPASVLAQQPTGSVPTVTGTAQGPIVTVDSSLPFIHVHAGPGSFDYPSIGVLLANETAPAIGRARDREDWIQILYPGVPGSTGWVYALYVSLSPGARLQLVDIPATPTPF